MNNKMKIAVVMGIMCMLLTSAVLIQLSTIKEATKVVGTTYAAQQLKDEVLRWKDSYENLYEDLEEARADLELTRQEATTENGRGKELEEELSNVNKLLGLTELTGSGVIITLSDNNDTTVKDLDLESNPSNLIVHDGDLRSVINELNNAGAEAISVNGQRIMSTTAITCSGAVITINGVKLNTPFEISAIGNPESLFGVARAGGAIEIYIQDRGVNVDVRKSNNVVVAKYTGTISTPKYIKTVK